MGFSTFKKFSLHSRQNPYSYMSAVYDTIPTYSKSLQTFLDSDSKLKHRSNGGVQWSSKGGNVKHRFFIKPNMFVNRDPDFKGKPSFDFVGSFQNVLKTHFRLNIPEPATVVISAKYLSLGITRTLFDGFSRSHGSLTDIRVEKDLKPHVFAFRISTEKNETFIDGSHQNIFSRTNGVSKLRFFDGIDGDFKIASMYIYKEILSNSNLNIVGSWAANRFGLKWNTV